ncbi:MAG: outer membrane beta-barrel protein [Bdellovibrionota bacterium]
MSKKFFFVVFLFFAGLGSSGVCDAFEYVHLKESYEKNRYLAFDAGLGFSKLSFADNVRSTTGFGMRAGLGHHFSKFLFGEFYYQVAWLGLRSPDPVDPTLVLDSTAVFHQEVLRVLIKDFRVAAMPYLSAGIGAYQFSGVDSSSSLSFPTGIEFPIGVGIKAFLHKDIISLNADFTYHFLLGENQSSSTLQVINRNKVAFDAYSVMVGFEFNFF